jgi:glycosyltransferase involved in cell wall biosynthesis
MSVALRFCPNLPVWGSQKTYAEEFVPRFLQTLPDTIVYSSLHAPALNHNMWRYGSNPLNERGIYKRIIGLLRYQHSFAAKVLSEGASVLFCPFSGDGLAFPGKLKQVLIVHDTIPLNYPKDYRVSWLLWKTLYTIMVRNSAHIVCVSEATRKDVITRVGVDPAKVTVVYNGYNRQRRSGGDREGGVILYVASSHGAHKNIIRLIDAFSRSRLKSNYYLHIVGTPKERNTPAILSAINNLNLSHRVRLLKELSNAELAEEYNRAKIFVYPSLCEGFGLPILEAMTAGIPVCASNCSAIPEVAGDAAIYFDPYNPTDIARKMEELVGNEKLAGALVSKGYGNILRFSWDDTATKCSKICRELAER